eukprot:1484381-Rhodomonas_salina.1
MKQEIGSSIDIGLRAFGKKGILETLQEQTFKQACWREDEWIPIWTLGVNDDVQDKILPQVWKFLQSSQPSLQDLSPSPLSLHRTGLISCEVCSPTQRLLASDPTFVSQWGNDGTCIGSDSHLRNIIRVPPQDCASAWLAEQSRTILDQLPNTDSAGRVSFDYGS